MKKLLLPVAVLGIIALSLPVMAEEDIFKDVMTVSPPPAAKKVEPVTDKSAQNVVNIPGSNQMKKDETLTTQSLQTSVSSLESAQNELKSKLQVAQQNYDTVDKEYIRVKNERAQLKKIVKKTNSRIKSLEKTKKSIQKNIQSEI